MKIVDVKRRFENGQHIVTTVQHVMRDVTTTIVTQDGTYVSSDQQQLVEEQVDVLRTQNPDKADNVARELRERHGVAQ